MARSLLNAAEQIASNTITWALMATGAIVPTTSLVDGANFVKKDGSVTMTAALNLGGFAATNSALPVNATDVTSKAYVDAKVAGFALYGARVMSTTNVASLSGLLTVDGVTTVAGNIVLLTGQTTQSQNGPWIVASGGWTRPTWFASASTAPEGAYFLLDADGTTFRNTKWWMTNTGVITVDTTSLTFLQDNSGTSYSAGNGITLSGSSFSVNAGNGISAASAALAAVGYGARLCTVDANGIGITDGTPAQLVLANASNHASWATMSGDVTIGSTGVAAVNHTSGSGFVKYTDFVWNETPSGAVNSSNTSFTLASTPANTTTALELCLNGSVLEPGSGNDFTISGTTITMLFAPATGDKLRAYYLK